MHDEPNNLRRFEDATSQEFDDHFAYRLTYKLRDYAEHCDLPPLWIEAHSERVGANERSDTLAIELRPGELLEAWDGWGAPLKSDLTGRSEPIELIPLVEDAMACIERVMSAIIIADAREHKAAAQLVVDAVERLPEGALENGAEPALFATEMEKDYVKNLSPTPLPLAQARDMLNPPPAPNGGRSGIAE